MTQNSLFELSFCPFGKDIRIILSATELILKINGPRTNVKGRTSSLSLFHCLTRRIFWPYRYSYFNQQWMTKGMLFTLGRNQISGRKHCNNPGVSSRNILERLWFQEYFSCSRLWFCTLLENHHLEVIVFKINCDLTSLFIIIFQALIWRSCTLTSQSSKITTWQ